MAFLLFTEQFLAGWTGERLAVALRWRWIVRVGRRLLAWRPAGRPAW